MRTQEWAKIKHFSYKEFDSPDQPGSGIRMRWETMSRLDQIRETLGYPLVVNSGVRTPLYNSTVGGVDGSAHTDGYAADIACRSSQERFALIREAVRAGFSRIGVGKSFIHLDADPSKPQSVVWLYP